MRKSESVLGSGRLKKTQMVCLLGGLFPHQDEFGSYWVVTLLSAAWHPPIAVTLRRLPVESSAFRLGRDSLSPFLGITHSLENSRKLPCQGLISWPYDF